MRLLLSIYCIIIPYCLARPTERERVELWHKAGNQWPPTWQNETDEFKEAMRIRNDELFSDIKAYDERWENFMQYTQGLLVPHFTEHGFNVVQAPPELHQKLLKAVRNAVANWDDVPYEQEVDAIYHPEGMLPKFVHIGSLGREVHQALLPMHEEWGGMKLRPTSAYGVRLYQNGSSLAMHHDKVETHVISSIFHIDHEYDNDSEPWPIEIEDSNGKLHAVALERGQILHYESAKRLHGRMTSLKGKYYGSLFLHYMPVDKSIWNFSVEDVIANVPPHWSEGCLYQEGARWAGQAITTDSRVAAGAPPREKKAGIRSKRSEL